MTARDRRALLVGGVAILGAFFALRVLPGLTRYYAALRVHTAESVATLERAYTALRWAPVVEDSLTALASQIVTLAPQLVGGQSAADGAANLTSELSLAAERAGLRVVAINAVPDSTQATLVPIVLKGQLEGNVSALATFLKAVEGGRTLLTLRSLYVQAGDPLEQQAGPEQLRLEIVIAGWRINRSRS
jgi:hypothetical protein